MKLAAVLFAAVLAGCSVDIGGGNDGKSEQGVSSVTIGGGAYDSFIGLGVGGSLEIADRVIVQPVGISAGLSFDDGNSAVFSVSNSGRLTGLQAGSGTLTVSAGGVSARREVRVGITAKFVVDGSSFSDGILYFVDDEIPVPDEAERAARPSDGRIFKYWENGDRDRIGDAYGAYIVGEGTEFPEMVFEAKYDTAGTEYTVTFDAGEGSLSGATSATVLSGSRVPKPADPVLAGKVFAGWFVSLSSSSPWNFDTMVVTEDLTLHAKFVDKLVPVSSITITPSPLSLSVGTSDNSKTLSVNILPENATNRNVVWNSSDESVVQVSSMGVVKAVKAGTARVTASAADGSGVSASVEVTVTAAPVKELASITVSCESEVYVDASAAVSVRADYSDGSFSDVSSSAQVSVSPAGIVSVSGNIITGIAEGTVTVTASYTEGGVTKTQAKTVSVTKEEQPFDGIRILVAKSFNFPLIHYFDCEDKVKYPNTTWPGVPMDASDAADYAFEFAGVSKISLLITNQGGDKLTGGTSAAGEGDVILTEKGTYRITASGAEKIVNAKPGVSISPEGASVALNGSITVSITAVPALSSADITINGKKTTMYAAGTKSFPVSDYASSEGATVSVSVSAKNSLGTTTETKTYTVSKAPDVKIVTNFNELRIYQVMVSSFQDGDPSIGYRVAYGPSGALTGGDLQGIINALDYIKSLGCNALWMTPIFDSTGQSSDEKLNSTGYYTRNYFDIDPNFGTKAKFAELVEKCHSLGINVILDGVFGHWGDTIVASPNGKTPQRSHSKYDGCDYPASLEFFQEVASYWIDNYKIDGWRLDQCYQAGVMGSNVYTGGHNYWYEIRQSVESAARRNSGGWGSLGYMVGEDWNGDASVIQSQSINPGSAGGYGLRSCFDFPARYEIVKTFAQNEVGDKNTELGKALSYVYQTSSSKGYYHPDGYYPNLFITNHDLLRFGNLINWYNGGSPSGGGDYWGRHRVALASLAAYTGPITIYYGDEWGAIVEGYYKGGDLGAYNDNVARSSGKISGFSSSEQQLVDWTSALMKMRAENEALWNGSNRTVTAESNFYVGEKEYNGTKITYAINSGTGSRTFNASGTNLLTGAAVNGSVTVDSYSAAFVRQN